MFNPEGRPQIGQVYSWKSWSDFQLEIGTVIPCPIGAGEEVSGEAAGLTDNVRLRGVGPVPMEEIRHPEELTEAVGKFEYAAVVIAL